LLVKSHVLPLLSWLTLLQIGRDFSGIVHRGEPRRPYGAEGSRCTKLTKVPSNTGQVCAPKEMRLRKCRPLWKPAAGVEISGPLARWWRRGDGGVHRVTGRRPVPEAKGWCVCDAKLLGTFPRLWKRDKRVARRSFFTEPLATANHARSWHWFIVSRVVKKFRRDDDERASAGSSRAGLDKSMPSTLAQTGKSAALAVCF